MLLAQLLFLPLLRRHQRTILRILGLQGGDQPRLLRQAFLQFRRLLPRGHQLMRQQRAVAAEADGRQQQQQQPALHQFLQPAAHAG